MSQNLLAEAESLISTMHSMLSDLHENFGWDELTSSLEDVSAEMQALVSKIEAKKKASTVEVCTSHFVGQGEKAFLFTGWVSGASTDEEDISLFILADNASDAYSTFVSEVKKEATQDIKEEDIYIISSRCLSEARE